MVDGTVGGGGAAVDDEGGDCSVAVGGDCENVAAAGFDDSHRATEPRINSA